MHSSLHAALALLTARLEEISSINSNTVAASAPGAKLRPLSLDAQLGAPPVATLGVVPACSMGRWERSCSALPTCPQARTPPAPRLT
jgi:hypothetical protein